MAGWILLHRSILKHWVWLSPLHTHRWIYILLNASYEDRQVEFSSKVVSIKRGQLLTTYRQLQADWKTSSDVVHNFLKALERNNMITIDATKEWTMISVCNYERYQSEFFSPRSDDYEAFDETEISHQFATEKLHTLQRQKQGEAKCDSVHSKINKEDNNINNITLSPRERLKSFFEELKSSDLFFDDCMRTFHVSKEELMSLLKQFQNEMLAQDKVHRNFSDYKSHFFNWLKYQYKKPKDNGQPKQQSGAGTAQNQRSARRGTDVADKTAADYGGSF